MSGLRTMAACHRSVEAEIIADPMQSLAHEIDRTNAMSAAWDDMAAAALCRDNAAFKAAQTRFWEIAR